MARLKSQYVCQECGHSTSRWFGRCPACQAWNTLVRRPFLSPSADLVRPLWRRGHQPQRFPGGSRGVPTAGYRYR